ncbi:ATP-dependent RNA helicase DOB1 [Astathelohania contejeani]|uniref:ATP-dependent RNA helicase DOB1 n=1 Tax=Astathelohania contejeani TaxID=164912 RepID=A0ABQ7I2L1_9MICR|nr:ATP-dependent RNA helicase DOB1 [Thelohania contejeani]
MDEHFEVFNDDTNLVIAPMLPEKPQILDQFVTPRMRHEALVPPNKPYENISTNQPVLTAKTYNFELDDFQKVAVQALERDESVLVSAHTSAGKTVVAEYAIAMALRDNQRVVYTSPIKALSNQKYRELTAEFQDVGLMTGDVTLNPQASCLVMTTEILRNMLYKGSEVMREVHWIIFDEIHYMRDKERGVVWEETIILLPPHIRMVFLSATIPNAAEFAGWVATIHSQIVHVVYTEKRPTPLTHYFVPQCGTGMYKVKGSGTNDNSNINDDAINYDNLNMALRSIKKSRDQTNSLGSIIESLIEQNNLPTIVFSFRRKDCEKYALCIDKDFLNDEEKQMIKTIFHNALSSLRPEDRNLPLIQNILPILLRGVGIHHSGLLPIIKEIVEILFQENLLKILFATETFSIGLNMPARSVVFTDLQKFDGQVRRLISPGEYVQMSGRAGRRGLDARGMVIALLTDPITSQDCIRLLEGGSDVLHSAFHLTYNMILNLLRVEGLDPIYLLQRSFFHYQRIQKAEKIETVAKFYQKLVHYEEELIKRNKHLVPKFAPFLVKGRVINLLIERDGVPLRIRNCVIIKNKGEFIDVCFFAKVKSIIKQVPAYWVDEIFDLRIKIDSVRGKKYYDKKFKRIEGGDNKWIEGCLLCGDKYPSEECFNGECYTSEDNKLNNKINNLFNNLINNMNEEFSINDIRREREIYLKNKKSLDNSKIYHLIECKRMIDVLKILNYYDSHSVLIKGRMACELSTGDELILTEMLFNGDFVSLPVEELVALLSCLVFEEVVDDCILSENNSKNYLLLKNTVLNITSVMAKCGLMVDPESYLKRFSSALMDVVSLWVNGSTFADVCSRTSVFEGSIIRCFRRLEELLRQLCNAARSIGNTELENVFSLGITKIKRDIVFANSLYL